MLPTQFNGYNFVVPVRLLNWILPVLVLSRQLGSYRLWIGYCDESCVCCQNLVFAILIADNQLVTMVRMKKYSLQASDLHLIFNLVSSSESFKAAESWTPICLPNFDSRWEMQWICLKIVKGKAQKLRWMYVSCITVRAKRGIFSYLASLDVLRLLVCS